MGVHILHILPNKRGLAKRLLTREELAKLLFQLEEPYRSMVMVAVLTGMRIGELLALRWHAVDLENRNLLILESVFKNQFQAPKSRYSIRTLPIGTQLCQVFEALRRNSRQTGPDDLVFPGKDGGPHRAPYLLQEILQPAARAAGNGHVTWHQFRHVHSSLLHNQGVPAKVVQQQLGHASVETTMRIYTHAVPGVQRHAIEALELLLFPSVPKFDGGSTRGGFVN